MQYFVGIVPPNAFKEKLISFQKQWRNNQLLEVVEPHITIKAQGGLTDDLEWLEILEKERKHVSPFELTVGVPAMFGSDVLYLSIHSKEIMKLHKQIVDRINPPPELIKKYFELDDYHPHLTLGQTSWGLSESELKKMKKAAEKDLSSFLFKVDFLRVYQEKEPNKYIKYRDISLG